MDESKPIEVTPENRPIGRPRGKVAASRRLPLSKSGNLNIDKQACHLRNLLERATIERHGEISTHHAVAIWAAARAFKRAQRIERRLKDEGEGMSPADWLSCLARATSCEESMTRHIKALNLAGSVATVWDHVYSRKVVATIAAVASDSDPPSPIDSPPGEDAPEGQLEGLEGESQD